MEDDLKLFVNGRRSQVFQVEDNWNCFQVEDDWTFKMEDNDFVQEKYE